MSDTTIDSLDASSPAQNARDSEQRPALVRKAWLSGGVAAAAGLAALARWFMQSGAVEGGTTVLYTNTSRTFYETDPLLGFTETGEAWFWLGLDYTGAIFGAAVALAVAGWVINHFADRLSGALVRAGAAILFVLGAVTWAVPVAAFTSGLPPEGVWASVPEEAALEGASDGSFATGEAGTYTVVGDTEASTLVAAITAGGETFDTTFSAPSGSITFAPTAVDDGDAAASFVLPVDTLDTGVPLRTDHALDYLKHEEHPEITLDLEKIASAKVDESGKNLEFEAQATLGFMGERFERTVTGRLVQLDGADRSELGIEGDAAHYLVRSSFTFDIVGTPLEADLDAFDESTVPITVRLLVKRTGE